MTTLACANLGFGRSKSAHHDDVERMQRRAQVVCTQEDLTGLRRERIRVDGRTGRRGSILASLSRLGYKIRLRRVVWCDVKLKGIGWVRVVCVHMPPRRMPGLVPVYKRRLHRLLVNSPHPWIAAGDWNKFLGNDPADLKAAFGGEWFGPNEGDRRDGPGTIDGFHVHPDLVRYVEDCWNRPRPNRSDGHPFVYLKLHG